MDANGLNFGMLSTVADWLPKAGSDTLYFCSGSNRLRLRSSRDGGPPRESASAAKALVETAPMSRDSFGNYARWDATSSRVLAGGSATGEVPIYTPPAGQSVSDLAMGSDGVLYLAVSGTLVLVDRRGRWDNATLAPSDFQFWRLEALPQGGVIALDRNTPQLGIISGLPLQIEPTDSPNPGILRSCQQNANPPRIVSRAPLPATEAFVAISAMQAGTLCLLSWSGPSAPTPAAMLRTWSAGAGLSNPWTLTETVFPYAVAWLGAEKLAIFATGLKEALIYDLQGAPATLVAAGDTYILVGENPGPFAHGFDPMPYYAVGAQIYPLVPLSLNSLAALGQTASTPPITLDGGTNQTIWHRLFLEAILPPRCGVLVWLAASNDISDFYAAPGTLKWFPHVFGAVDSPLLPSDAASGAWVSVGSEVAFARPMLNLSPVKNLQGLFMALIQRPGRVVRNLSGRYLGVRVQLNGDRRSTPEIAALRVYHSRFSYVSNYLPELYREDKFGTDADAPGSCTRRDFFERFVNIFEAQMTRIEDRVANSYLLTRPESTPDSALDWLGGWVGVESSGYPPGRKRAHLLAAPALHRKRGTVSGIIQAIDVATDGLCTRGAVLVLEDFRLRHIFATILGADLSISNDPLLPGHTASDNSFVGDTLFLGDPRNLDFLAEYATSVATPGEQQQVDAFLDSLAYRITVFIHNQVEAVNISLIQQIVEHEKPAHIAATFRIAKQPFLIGMASLLGVNSYLASEPAANPAVVDVSLVGRYNLIQHAPSLDPRWENG